MKKWHIFLSCFCLILSSNINSQTYNRPESIVFDTKNNGYLVSNAANGFSGGDIVFVDPVTYSISSFVSSGLNSPKGMCIIGDTLFVTDVTSIKKINLNTKAVFGQIEIPGSQFLNDIANVNNKLFVSDNVASKIFIFSIDLQQLTTLTDTSIRNPNGLLYDYFNSRILFCSYRANSPIQVIDPSTNVVTKLSDTDLSNLDGLTMDPGGNVYVSSWTTNKVYVFTVICCGTYQEISSWHNGPADIFFANSKNILTVPNMNANTVDFINMQGVGIEKRQGKNQIEINYDFRSKNIVVKGCPNEFLKITISNSLGQSLKSLALFADSSAPLNINVDQLPIGIYIVNIQSRLFRKSEKVLIY